jgi:methionyl-tRNA formyltransferase
MVTQPDRPAGRGRTVTIGPIKRFARDRKMPVIQPEDVNAPAAVRRIQRAAPDLLLVIAYGQKLGPRLLGLARHGAINLHGSLLPKYRGAAPVNWAIIRGETETGLSVIAMTSEMDAGDILGQRATVIGPHETAGQLHDRLADLGARLVMEVVRDLTLDEVGRRRQNETQATAAPRLRKNDGLIRWDRPAQEVYNHIRGMTPWPGATTFLPAKPKQEPMRLVVTRAAVAGPTRAKEPPGTIVRATAAGLDVAAADGIVRLLELTPAGKRTMSAADFLHGHPVVPGTRLASGTRSAEA